MRRTVLVLTVILAIGLVCAPAASAVKWKYPLYSVAHASDGYGLTNGQLSLHRVYPSRHWMLDTFTIYGTTYTWTRPLDASYLTTGWTFESVVSCSQCHSSISPGGSSGSSGYPDPFDTLRLDSATANGMSSTTVICAKCHDLVTAGTWSNVVHESSKHRDEYGHCVSCHVQMPHGSGLPRLLGYANDPSPYSTLSTGLAGIRLQSYTPTSWRKTDCTSDCHARSFVSWPSGGSIGGTVVNSQGTPIPGATVSISVLSTTTAAGGTYRLDALGAGYTTVIIDAAGYFRARVPAVVFAGALNSVDATLIATP